jgi:hypothetical protein
VSVDPYTQAPDVSELLGMIQRLQSSVAEMRREFRSVQKRHGSCLGCLHAPHAPGTCPELDRWDGVCQCTETLVRGEEMAQKTRKPEYRARRQNTCQCGHNAKIHQPECYHLSEESGEYDCECIAWRRRDAK